MAGIYNGPLPTRLTSLSDLPKFSPGEKVRFLGCVNNYAAKSAILTLEHNHPKGQSTKALVDVKLLLTTMKSGETLVGEWINVIGYVNAAPQGLELTKESSGVHVQALILWSAGSFDLHGYEKSLDQQNPERIKHESFEVADS